MAVELENENVASYLTKHKVAALFEELMAKVSKQLPNDPVEFLIKKLQLLQQQRSKKKVVATNVASISPTKILPQGSRIQVTGTSMASKTSKSPVSEKIGKSTSGLRPLKTKPVGLSTSSSAIKSVPAKTPPTRVARPATSSITSKVAIKSGGSLKPPSSTSRSTTTSKPAMSRPATAPGTTKTGSMAGQRTSGLPKKVSRLGETVSSPRKKLSQSPAKPCPTVKTELEDKKNVEGQGVVGKATADEKKNEATAVCKKDKSVEQIDEFFGDDIKSSLESEEEEKGEGVEREESDEDEGVEGVLSTVECGDNSLDIQTIMRRREESANGRRRNKKTRHKNLQSLLLEEASVRTTLSLSVHDATESSEGEVEMVEDGDALRDEGVEVTKETRVVLRKSLGGSVLCARCACTLGEGDSSSVPPSLDFESASQVAGPVAYPHWGPDSSSTERLQTNESDQYVSSQVSLQSNDTWGGLAPAPLPQTQLSDEESDVQLPPGLPLEGHSRTTTSATHPHASLGWGQQD